MRPGILTAIGKTISRLVRCSLSPTVALHSQGDDYNKAKQSKSLDIKRRPIARTRIVNQLFYT